MNHLRYPLVYLAWLLALVATGGSLYFSEVVGYIPCTLCWYQRIFMYPLVIVLGFGSYQQDRNAITYGLPFAVIGWVIALYHVLMQKLPNFGSDAVCAGGVSCVDPYINWFGFITIPVLSLAAFTGIAVLLLLSLKKAK